MSEGKGGYVFGGDKAPNTMVDTVAGKAVEEQKKAAAEQAGGLKEQAAADKESSPGVIIDQEHLRAIADHEQSAAKAEQINEAKALAERVAEDQRLTDYKNRLWQEHQKGDGQYFTILRDINTGAIEGTAEQKDDLARLKKFKDFGTRNATDNGSIGELAAVEVVFPRKPSEAPKPPGAWQRVKGWFGVS